LRKRGGEFEDAEAREDEARMRRRCRGEQQKTGRKTEREKESEQEPDRKVKKNSDFKAEGGESDFPSSSGLDTGSDAQARGPSGMNHNRVHHLPRKAPPLSMWDYRVTENIFEPDSLARSHSFPGRDRRNRKLEKMKEQLHSSYLTSPLTEEPISEMRPDGVRESHPGQGSARCWVRQGWVRRT
jgi:hypothetical protein